MDEALSAHHPTVLSALTTTLGHPDYRTGQAEVVDRVLAGRSTLAIMPTGGGKSLCYQLPAVVRDGLTVVISPLLALIRDQVQALLGRGIRAASFTSADDEAGRQRTYEALECGALDLLYVAPERFRSGYFVDRLTRQKIRLVAIDEAHCISQWGHDFRPDYAKLAAVLRALNPSSVIALTATATPEVQQDIVRSLELSDCEAIVSGFDRPNLELSVQAVSRLPKKVDEAALIAARWLGRGPGVAGPGTAIMYAATRKRTEMAAEQLRRLGWHAEAYHAGLESRLREDVQNRFQSGDCDIVVATTAFGMGVDKSDVRVVVHLDIPSSPESYYQEVGRAGRDGLPAGGALLYDAGDLRFAFQRLETSCPTADCVSRAFVLLGRLAGGAPSLGLGLDQAVESLEPEVGPATRAALIALDSARSIELRQGSIEILSDNPDVDGAFLDRRERVERGKLEAMIGYVQRSTCRRRYLVDYFGDTARPDACGVCDRCALPGARVLQGDAGTDVLKALSCVARLRGRYGRGRVVDVLLGSRARTVLDAGLDRMSTYGLMSTWSRVELASLFDSLARAGFVEQTHTEYPKLMLTEAGAECLRQKGEISIDLRLGRWGDAGVLGASPKGVRSSAVTQGPLFDIFRQWRKGVATSIGKPPYVVVHDRTLEAIVSERPEDLAALARMPGIGPAKLEAYGQQIISLLREHESN